MRALPWILVVLFLIVAFTTKSAGLMVLAWLVVLTAGLFAMLQLVDARINSKARHSASLLGPQELAALKLRAERQLKAKAAAAPDQAGAVSSAAGETGAA
ncbi:MAG: hypothetical protein AB7V26_10280 [Lysobacterales bacterium]